MRDFNLFYKHIVENSKDPLLILDEKENIIYTNNAFLEKMHYNLNEVINKKLEDLNFSLINIIDIKNKNNTEIIVKDNNNQKIHYEINKSKLYDENENINGQVLYFRDITLEKQKQKELKMFREAVNDAGYGIYITDINGVIKFVNPALIAITKYSEEYLIGQKTNIWKSEENTKDYYNKMWETILNGKTWEDNIINKRKNGEEYYAHQIIAPVKNEKGEIENFVAIQEDITEQKYIEEKLYEYATFDEMTGALNRRVGLEKIKKYVEMSKNSDFNFSICFLDVNYLKQINDTLGHKYGDSLLRKTANFIKKNIRSDDSFARMGGDEFLILFPECNQKQAEEIYKRIFSEAEEYNKSRFSPFNISFSEGIVEFNKDKHKNFDDILTEVDIKMYEKKKVIKQNYKPF
ncbi:MAG: diguanylate cyclase domain-containing protein [Thermotogota bacterium]